MYKKYTITIALVLILSEISFAQVAHNIINTNNTSFGLWVFAFVFILPLVIIIKKLYYDFKLQILENTNSKKEETTFKFSQYLKRLDRKQIRQFINLKNKKMAEQTKNERNNGNVKPGTMLFILLICTEIVFGQNNSTSKSLTSQPGIIITIVLLIIPVLLASIFALIKVNNAIKNNANINREKEAGQFANYLKNLDDKTVEEELVQKDKTPEFNLTHTEPAGAEKAVDTKGIISNVSDKHAAHFIAVKRKAITRPGY
jgi:cytochrome c oxidase cbb3-type subunit I